MLNKYIILYMIAVFVGNILVWMQTNSQLVWRSFPNINLYMTLLGVPISYIFIKATYWGFQGFEQKLWPIRIVGFVIGMFVFSLMTAVFMKELPDLKTIICLFLCLLVIIIQIFFK